jgi:hypothetical protein
MALGYFFIANVFFLIFAQRYHPIQHLQIFNINLRPTERERPILIFNLKTPMGWLDS